LKHREVRNIGWQDAGEIDMRRVEVGLDSYILKKFSEF